MKRKSVFVFLLSTVFAAIFLFATPALSQTFPDFKIRLTNGTTISSSKNLGKKPLLIIYFAPDCEHCRKLIDQLFPKMNDFKNTEILMVTFESLNDVAWFENHYQTKKYANIKVGMESPVFFLKNYYHLEHTPFTALFNKKGKLMISYKEYTPVNELIKWVKLAGKS